MRDDPPIETEHLQRGFMLFCGFPQSLHANSKIMHGKRSAYHSVHKHAQAFNKRTLLRNATVEICIVG